MKTNPTPPAEELTSLELTRIETLAQRLIKGGIPPVDAWVSAFIERSNATSPVRAKALELISRGWAERDAWRKAIGR
jgi:hypothetical protein